MTPILCYCNYWSAFTNKLQAAQGQEPCLRSSLPVPLAWPWDMPGAERIISHGTGTTAFPGNPSPKQFIASLRALPSGHIIRFLVCYIVSIKNDVYMCPFPCMLVKGSHIFTGLCELSSDAYKFGSFLKK